MVINIADLLKEQDIETLACLFVDVLESSETDLIKLILYKLTPDTFQLFKDYVEYYTEIKLEEKYL
ncbi:hypothetical protein [Campylobacter curvus]|jgi:hypothetical protein|uniref:hypothetical protein n=1 Tax=Campylobacter curvus TaxID=200 RepID=UPI00147044A2|nr:hypothetical protein [Campylobacter curvus]